MTTGTAAAPGWYGDPAGRHEFRYWDGRTWTASVSDGGITGSDALESAPETPAPQAPEAVPPPPAPPPAVPPPAGERVGGGEQQVEASGEPPAAPAGRSYGYQALAVATWRVAALYTAMLVALAATLFEVVASVTLRGSATDLGRWAWLYREGPAVALYGYPPLGLWLSLIMAVILTSTLLLPPAQALKKTGLAVMWRWSAREERRRLRAGLRALGRSRTLLRGRAGGAVAALAVLSALLVTAVSGYALLAHRGLLAGTGTARTATADLSAGLGPTLCLAAGAVAALLVVVAWPWRAAPNVLVLRDGSVQSQPPL